MKKGTLILLMVIGSCLTTFSGWAAVYVSDTLEVPLRIGPGPKHKIVSMLRSGEVVAVISEEEGWSHVRSMEVNGDKEGWILSRYLMNREPCERRIKDLEMENARLREALSPMEGTLLEVKTKNADLATALKEKTKELATLQENYESLKQGASGFLELRENFKKTRSDLARTEDVLKKTTEENKLLRESHRNRWFLTGALVLLLGLLIGVIIGRREKKRSSKLSF